MKLGTQVGLDPGHIVLDWDPAPLPQRDTASPNFRRISVAAKWLHGSRCYLVWSYVSAQATWCKMGTLVPVPKRGRSLPKFFGPSVLWPNGWMDQDGRPTWHGGRPQPRRGPSPSPQKEGGAPSPIFGPFLLWPNGWMHQDATQYGGRPKLRRVFLDGTQPP